ncbi:MAG: RNA polymerase sigma factor [Haliea sp.]|uniref:RNA polymerase sigma factor n=1 Tax=Marinobacter salarius TaxID=1420917 RepID=UPI0032EBB3DD
MKVSSISDAFIQHQVFLRRFLRRFLVDPRDVEDISQEAYLRAFQAEQSDVVRSPKAFLFRIARNLALNELSRRSRALTDCIDEASGAGEDTGSPCLEEQLQSEQRLALFCRAAARLPPQCRRAFLMRKVYGYTHREIAEKLGVSTSTVEKHIATGLYRCSQFMAAMEREDENSSSRENATVVDVQGRKACV